MTKLIYQRFTTDEDQKQHLEKEAHSQLLDEETTEEKQEKLDESHPHHIRRTKHNFYCTDNK